MGNTFIANFWKENSEQFVHQSNPIINQTHPTGYLPFDENLKIKMVQIEKLPYFKKQLMFFSKISAFRSQ